jgi:hypothetical protein
MFLLLGTLSAPLANLMHRVPSSRADSTRGRCRILPAAEPSPPESAVTFLTL